MDGQGGDSNWDVAQAELTSRGFEVQGSFIESLLYGAPQSRRRFYVVGLRSHLGGGMPSLVHVPWAIGYSIG